VRVTFCDRSRARGRQLICSSDFDPTLANSIDPLRILQNIRRRPALPLVMCARQASAWSSGRTTSSVLPFAPVFRKNLSGASTGMRATRRAHASSAEPACLPRPAASQFSNESKKKIRQQSGHNCSLDLNIHQRLALYTQPILPPARFLRHPSHDAIRDRAADRIRTGLS
jgi:hypothetical protein